MKEVNILLISDLHYDKYKNKGKDYGKAVKINRSLVKSLPAIKDDWVPDIVIVAGDLVNQGKKENYDLYFDLVARLTQKYPHLKNSFFATPGNHDINRENIVSSFNYLFSIKKKYPKDKSLDSFTSNEIINTIFTVSQYDLEDKKYSDLLSHLSEFEKRYFQTYLEMEKIIVKKGIINKQSKLLPVMGLNTIYISSIFGINLLSFNSSFFCNFSNTQNDRNNLFFIRSAIDRTLSEVSSLSGPVITFMHHPFYCMHESEFIYPIASGLNNKGNNYNKIAELSDLILSGHMHGELHEPSVIHQKVHSITNGTSYSASLEKDKSYPLTYAIIKVNKQLNKYKFRSMKYSDKSNTFGIANKKNSQYYYTFQEGLERQIVSTEIEKVRIIKYYKSLIASDRKSKSSFTINIIKAQLKVYEKSIKIGDSSTRSRQIVYNSGTVRKLSCIIFYCAHAFRIIVVKIDTIDFLRRLENNINTLKEKNNQGNISIFVAIDLDLFFKTKKLNFEESMEYIKSQILSLMLSSKFQFVNLNLIYF